MMTCHQRVTSALTAKGVTVGIYGARDINTQMPSYLERRGTDDYKEYVNLDSCMDAYTR